MEYPGWDEAVAEAAKIMAADGGPGRRAAAEAAAHHLLRRVPEGLLPDPRSRGAGDLVTLSGKTPGADGVGLYPVVGHMVPLGEPGYVAFLFDRGFYGVYRVLKFKPLTPDDPDGNEGGNDYVVIHTHETPVEIRA